MDIKDISIPEVYRSSADFRFFLNWIQQDLKKTQYDTENFFDLYDPLRCPQDLVWALADTMGYKYDSRMPTSFNRLVLLYFMSMIRNRGSKDGVTLAAEVNLAQFKLLRDAEGYELDGIEYPKKEILYNRLEDTSIPVNSVYVTPHTDKGYIELVYFSTRMPADICIEYVRPLGMFLFQNAGVSFDARTKISIDARLTDTRDSFVHDGGDGRIGLSYNFGPTQVGRYNRDDYARMQPDLLIHRGLDSSKVLYVPVEDDDPEPEDWNHIIPGQSNVPESERKRVYQEYYYVVQGSSRTKNTLSDWSEAKSQSGELFRIVYFKGSAKVLDQYPYGWRWASVNIGPDLDDLANPGQRALYNIQLCNSEKVVASLLDPIFSIGYGLQNSDVNDDKEIQVHYPDDYLSDGFSDNRMVKVKYSESAPRPSDWLSTYNKIYYTTDSNGRFILNKLVDWAEANKQSGGLYRQEYITDKPYNLRYNKSAEEAAKEEAAKEYAGEVLSYDDSEDQTPPSPTPKVNPIMGDSPDSYQNLELETPTVGSSMSTGD